MKTCTAIILAAGSSERMPGNNKLLLEIDEKPMLEHVLDRVTSQHFGEIVVVTQPDADAVGKIAEHYQVKIVPNPNAVEGMGTSLATACKQLSADTKGIFVFLADMPHVPASICVDLYDAALRQGTTIAAPRHNGQRGHPVYFSADLLPQLSRLTGDSGARNLIAAHRTAYVATSDPGVLRDYDTFDDFTS